MTMTMLTRVVDALTVRLGLAIVVIAAMSWWLAR